MAEAHALFYKRLKEVERNESKINVVKGKIQTTFFVRSAIAAKYTPEGERLAREGWNIKTDVTSAICTDFCDDFFRGNC